MNKDNEVTFLQGLPGFLMVAGIGALLWMAAHWVANNVNHTLMMGI